MSPLALFNADEAVKTPLARLRRERTTVADALAAQFGDDFSRALYRETKWQVPDSDRSTCPVHQDWRSHCIDLHVKRPTRPAAA
ncbi:hypothetical protein MUK60_07505 [Streptomyces sp. LRE541]|uniref:hypothetical protein n=1 Tax=Streptomyces sp. LRE541 TaxID=2931983 RepID=UPI00200F80C0|nr:hypothetical protein [Streptomyces sp. LRE541]UPZ27679.1 hypothetical protein MUK60_07505 [Streptomyces sp. LRE541]